MTMNIRIQSVKFDADQKLIDFIETKINRLAHLLDNPTDAEVTLKLDKDQELGNKVVIARLGGNLISERRSHTFEEAVDHCVDALRNQIEKQKDR